MDLYQLTGEPMDSFKPGKIVRVIDNEYGIQVDATITKKSKKDVRGAPGDVTLVIATKAENVADQIADLRSRASINELYSQGATNLITESIADNADAEHPIERTIYIPRECVKINKLRLRLTLRPFRAYSKSARASLSLATSSEVGGITSASTPQHVLSNNVIVGGPKNTGGGSISTTGSSSETVTGAASDGSPTHNHSLPSHVHGMYHYHDGLVSLTIPPLNIEMPAHTHTVQMPVHTHNINFGIYEGATASGYTVAVDGNIVPDTAFESGAANIIPYLATDEAGKILRDYDHTVTITPIADSSNADGLTRVEGQLVMQVFVRSQGGGDY